MGYVWLYICMEVCMYAHMCVYVCILDVVSLLSICCRYTLQPLAKYLHVYGKHMCLHVCMYVCMRVHFGICKYLPNNHHGHTQLL